MLEIDLRLPLDRFVLDVTAASPSGATMVFGPSGAGKSSLVKAIAGLIAGVEGHIRLGSRVLLDTSSGLNLPAHKRRIGYVFQEPRLFPHLSVAANLRYGAPHGTEIAAIAKMLDITALLSRRPGLLSGGEAARVALGRALLRTPDLLILDEPLAALDHSLKAEILPYLERLRDHGGIPMLYVTHAIEEVLRLGTTLMILRDGQIKQFGPVAKVLSDPQAAQDLGPRLAGAILPGQTQARDQGLMSVSTPAGPITVPDPGFPLGRPVRLRIMAQDVILSVTRPKGLSALNILPVTIETLHSGPHMGVMVRLVAGGVPLLARITKRSAQALGLAPGQNIYAVLKTVSIAQDNLVQHITQDT